MEESHVLEQPKLFPQVAGRVVLIVGLIRLVMVQISYGGQSSVHDQIQMFARNEQRFFARDVHLG